MSRDELAELRHDLRTPINHIIGYGEMLRDDAVDLDVPALLPGLEKIVATGKALLELLNHRLGPSRGEVSPKERADLNGELVEPTAVLMQSAAELLAHADLARLENGAEDLERVKSAAQRLRDLGHERLLGQAAPPPPPPSLPPPVVPPTSSAVQDEAQTAPDEGNRILVVDDNEANRDMLRRQLERQGYQVETAANGRLALDMVQRGGFSLVLLDILMPELDGYQVLETLKADAIWHDLPVIMISALDEIASVVRCIEIGAEDYLPKPFDPVLLRARIGASLEKKRLRDEERRATAELAQTLQKLRTTQDQLVMQEKLASLGALVAGIAHEIKNPLNFVINFALQSQPLIQELREVLAAPGSPGPSEDVKELLGFLEQNVAKISEHGKRADSIVRNMLLHSRTGAGERQPTDLNALLAEYVRLAYHGWRTQDQAFNLTIEEHYDPAVGQVDVVAQELSRVFLNIANNACYAVNEKRKTQPAGYMPTVTVRTKNLAAAVEVRIRDNGPGISRANREKIFQPFFTTKPAGSGTGLGLSLSFDIVVQMHQGEFRLESEEGQYAEFVIVLPRASRPSPA